LFVAH
jgi:hypothetical protein